MDDARNRKTRPFLPAAAGLVLCLLLGGALAVALASRFTPRDIARFEAVAGERRERDWSAETARERLLADFARDAGGGESMAAARRALRATLAAAVPSEPLPELYESAEVAARLRGLSVALRGLAHAAPIPSRGGASAGPGISDASLPAIRAAAAASDVAALDAALAAELAGWEQALRDRAAGLEARDRSLLWSGWRELLESRAAEFEFLAAEREAAEPDWMRVRIAPHAALRALTIEPLIPDPAAVLAAYPAEPPNVVVSPIRNFWAAVALAGMLAGAVLFAALRALRRRPELPAPLAAPGADPADERDWLQVVSGGKRDLIARAVCELAAHPLSRRQRVVVVDASRHLRLNETLRLSPRLGFIECVTQGLPALGLLQSGGFTGLYLLARGRHGRVTDWLPLDRVLEELRPHFSRVILAFDSNIPAVVGGVLAGRFFTGWWAGPGPAKAKAGAQASQRLAIALADLDLSPVPKASLEAIEARLVALAGVVSVAPAAGPVSTAAPAEFRVSPPAVLDCDSQIRQKLRYLAWMRRMRTEREGTETANRP
jgi:hypothetical protein